ncbi:phosphatase PAP2 family protein [Kocuria sp. ZOR0020]|uniref:phosphatase PAP2 family protein n=1 Tax=Kocuria sp. ZOR0020 TaxID=1339234 RepID=UPI00068B2D20|nr:phosphatase PAP2 family protein [Kocuria sp. ZOR0020]
MTYIPAENDPHQNRRSGSGSSAEETPTEAITTPPGTRGNGGSSASRADSVQDHQSNPRTESISASSDPTVTRPMPSVSGASNSGRYQLSADPETTALETTTGPGDSGAPAPWQDTRQQPVHQPLQQPGDYRGGPEQQHGQSQQFRQPQQQPVGQAPADYGATAHPAAPRTPARDLSFGIVMGLLLRAVLLFAAAGGLAFYALRTVGGQWADELALQEGDQALNQLPTAWVPWIDLVPVLVCVLWGAVALLFAVGSRRWVPLLVGVVSGLGAVVSVQLLKREFLVKAPYGIHETTMNSLPSGHTAAAATAAMIAVMTAPARWRGAVAFFGALTTAAAGISTVLNGWHRPMDAMVSVLVVACWAVVGALLLRCLIRPERYTSNLSVTTLVLGILLVLAAAGGLAAMQTVTITGLPLAAGAAGIVGFSLLAAHQTVRALRPHQQAV